MFVGTGRRIISMWFPRLPSDRVLRLRPIEGPFAVTLRLKNAEKIHCLNPHAEAAGLHRGMTLSDARAFCPELRSHAADPADDARVLHILRRWVTRYCPWAGLEGRDGLTLDITGSAHLWGNERSMRADMQRRLERAGFAVRTGLADTHGAAWALARHGGGIAAPGESLAALAALPVAALRLDEGTDIALQRLGLRRIGALAEAPRAPLARRFGPELLQRLDQATGAQPEAITPLADPPHYAARLTLPEPIGLISDVMAGMARLLDTLCARLKARETGARALRLTLRRVDQQSRCVDLRLATAMRDPARILPLFARGVEEVDAGFGIDQLRLEATLVEPLPVLQTGPTAEAPDRLDNLITRIGTRIGLDNILRFLPADSHIPERSFVLAPAAGTKASGDWPYPLPAPDTGSDTGSDTAPGTTSRAILNTTPQTASATPSPGPSAMLSSRPSARPRPLRLFPPEPITAHGAAPPARFRWRRISLTTARATGPERIAPEWWAEDDNWRSGLRDYWQVETHQGWRLWLFHTPQNPGWYVQGEFA